MLPKGGSFMICKRCGANIDPRRKRADGSLQCPQCKVIYRPRSTQSQALQPQPQITRRQTPRKKRSGIAALWNSIPWKRKYFKLPVWLWTIIALIILFSVFPSSDNGMVENADVTATNAPVQQLESNVSNDWETRYNNTKDDVLAYLNSVFSQYKYFNEPFLDYYTESPDIYCVTADITVNGADISAVKDALRHIENQLLTSPYKFNFQIGMMSTNGATICIATFGEEYEGYTILASGRSATYSTIDEIPEATAQVEKITPTNALAPANNVTMGERNALSMAKTYLSVMAFSYNGLGKQLMYEGYTKDEAKYAVDNCGADWYEQAAKQAKAYLDTMAFSKQGLIEQLEYDGFTNDQAVYGVEQNGY